MELISNDKFITDTFFLTGGTALAEFYFQHRLSEDLDFFSESEVNSRKLLVTVSKISKAIKVSKLERQTLTGQEVFYFHFDEKDLLKIDFSYFPFQHLGQFKKFNNLRISSIEDITVNKIHAITSRKRARDYIDLYYCINRLKWKASDIKKNYKLKFDVDLSYEQLATSFTNVVDATDMPTLVKTISWDEVQKYFLGLAKDLKTELMK